ncbi:glycerol-3-phosphate acyltransferase PlsX [Ameyamaea chiangmaiensis NBRC 103196]|uniref:Phosphate acyltransferase n=1 Tax=Ameyamaea chiangmaiensis TaxID=442969 RepID=A0A850P3J2_9PROT|nr:phosphate acyltransferase PlsX [Ameyamaea chiangmaiensis]MBS4074501.1 phosphate acyltransferase PlsX [Ameyamaea chiangmaiensis]NVN39235.1 phosphate acyltransferase PlsX [Ameyamaea chiangmaiensis]GBQ72270.1 glycerol-3-phosphate acyltransferase PlsX [Ameyamaea chiangmaiensis NBRC 103196]
MTDTVSLSPTPEPYTLAVDGMGGDAAPDVVVAGLDIAADRHPGLRVLLLGDEARLAPLLVRHPKAARVCTVRHAASVVSMDMKPTAALRVRDSSLRLAMDAVAEGEALGVVSAGNSGAMLALAKIVVKTMPGISRPAMAAISPTARGDIVMLDLGANVSCDWRNLVEFAVMGEAFAKAVLGLPAPTIGLLNVGSEELKGDERLRQAADVLRDSPLAAQFHGFVEGHDITAGTTDVVVTDGFTGNVALKTGEGALKLAFDLLRRVFTSSWIAKIGYLLVRPGLERMREWLDPRRYNGAVFVGLNGVVVKSHGGTDAEGFASAVDVAVDMVAHGFNETIRARLARMGSLTAPVTRGEPDASRDVVEQVP